MAGASSSFMNPFSSSSSGASLVMSSVCGSSVCQQAMSNWIVRRKRVVRVICENPKHKQRQG